MKHFCSLCGKATIYALAVPKFCSECGSDFSVVTKTQDKSVHDQALEKAKEKYQVNTPQPKPVTKAPAKNYPNPARASFKLIPDEQTRIVDPQDEDADEYSDDQDMDQIQAQHIDTSKFKHIKPKFALQPSRNTSESFENIMTQGYASNYKSLDAEEMGKFPESPTTKNPMSVLEEFKREAGTLRGQGE